MKKLILYAILLNFSFSLQAQQGISLEVDYETPLGELSEVYKPTLSFTGSFVLDYDKFICNFSLGYLSFGAKQDTFHYRVNTNEHGVATYGRYYVVPLYAGIAYKIPIAENLGIHVGGDIGYYYTWFRVQLDDDYINLDEINIEGKAAVSPKIGIAFNINENIALKFQTKYNLFFSLGSLDPYAYDYNPNLGTFNSTWSNGLTFIWVFSR